MQHRASCHCGAIQVEIEAPAHLTVQSCNCSMCERTGFLHVIVPASPFSLGARRARFKLLYLQYWGGKTLLLQALRLQTLLHTAFQPRWI